MFIFRSAKKGTRLNPNQEAHKAGAYLGIISMKRLGVFLLLPRWDVSPSQGYPPVFISTVPFIHLGRKRHAELSVLPQNTTQCLRLGSSPDRSLRIQAHLSSHKARRNNNNCPNLSLSLSSRRILGLFL